MTRQGEPRPDDTSLLEQYEKFNTLAKKYPISVDPNLQTLLVPSIYKTDNLRARGNENQNSRPRYTSPGAVLQNISPTEESNQLTDTGYVAQAEQVHSQARLAQIDKEALSKISEEDRKLIESTLSLAQREALLTQLENGQLDNLLPRDENRFGGMGLESLFSGFSGGFNVAASQLGASAGRYIGSKLAGTMGAKLGAAAGAYLGAAAASRFVKQPAQASRRK